MRAHQGIAFRTAYLLAGDATLAEEAAQDAFVKAYRALGRFRRGAPFRPWLLRIVANEARNRRRGAGPPRGRRAARRGRNALGGRGPVPRDPGSRRRAPRACFAALGTLREDDRLVVAYRYFLDLSEAETAAALGVRPGTVKSRLSRALERLRAQLESA